MPTSNPWKTLSSQVIYENNWISLREDKVIRPDGQKGIYGFVSTRIAVGVIALTPQREIYLVGQYRYPTNHYSWEIVEGGADEGEEPLMTAKRELQEEAGLAAEKWMPLGGELHLSNCISSEVGYLFIAEELRDVQANPDGTEVLHVKKVPLAEAIAMVDEGEITDGLSIMGIFKLDRLARQEAL